MVRLAIVVPCYNEEEVIESSIKTLHNYLEGLIEKQKVTKDSFLLFVNDGSKDHTWELIEKNYALFPKVNGISLSANVGHQHALWAGLMAVKGFVDAAVTIDADLQDDVSAIEEMLSWLEQGRQIVYGVKKKRKADSLPKRVTAEGFYKFMRLLGVKTVYNHADFRLLGRDALNALSQYKERNLFLRGMVPLLGFETAYVYEEIRERTAGKSKYSLKKMIDFAIDGITSFSIKPLSLIAYLGVLILLICIIMMAQALIAHLSGDTVEGWTSLILSIWFIGGVQLLSLGVIGQYVGKTYVEVKERPRYHIEKSLIHGQESKKEKIAESGDSHLE